MHTAIIPELRFGGALIRNAVVLVMEDKELDINLGTQGHYLIEGIFGYPLISALGRFTIFGQKFIVNTLRTALRAGSNSPGCSPFAR